jgi:hypothetical protein
MRVIASSSRERASRACSALASMVSISCDRSASIFSIRVRADSSLPF